ncbi:MAG: SDR family oxidoreductase [Bacteroidia bacterium]
MSALKIAVITGGTRGIGRSLVNKFLADGFTVYTSARKAVQSDHSNLRIFQADLSDKSEVKRFAEWVSQEANHIDVLINNVGTYIPGKITSEEDGVFETQMNTNVASTYNVTRALIHLVRKSGKAYIFNICSTASIMPYLDGGSYCISKYAQLGLTKVLREELKADKISVTAVLPGATLTSSWEGTDLPKERFIDPDSVAQLIWTAYQLGDSTVIEEILIRPMDGDIV